MQHTIGSPRDRTANYFNYFNATMLGAIFIAAFPPISVAPAAIVSVILLTFIFFKSKSWKHSMLLGAFAGGGFGAAGYYWFFYAVQYATQSAVLAVASVVGAVAVMMFLYSCAAVLLYLVREYSNLKKALFVTCIWSSLEFFRSCILFGGTPLHLMCETWMWDTAMLQTAALIGMHGLSMLTYFLSALALVALSELAAIRRLLYLSTNDTGFCFLPKNISAHRKVIIIVVSIAAVILLGLHQYGKSRVKIYNTWVSKVTRVDSIPSKHAANKVVVIQPNENQGEKLSGVGREEVLNSLLRTTKAITSNYSNTLVVWPETSLKDVLTPSSSVHFLDNALLNNATLIAGAIRVNNKFQAYNTAIIYNPAQKSLAFYDKIHLVPFGEYIPFSYWIEKLLKSPLFDSQLHHGKNSILCQLTGFPKFKILICFEVLFSQPKLSNRSFLALVNISDEAWFDESIEAYAALSVARFRAIEGGIPLIRCANTGISVIIDSLGRVCNYLKLNTKGFIIGSIPNRYPDYTFFSYSGNSGVFSINIVLVLALLLCLFQDYRVFSAKKREGCKSSQ